MNFKIKKLAIIAFLLSGMVSMVYAQAPMTTDHGAPIGDNQDSKTVGPNGPTLLEDTYLIEKLSRFDRERIPERVVHARGTGAFGVFHADTDVSDLTKASFLIPGKDTPVFVRFSTVIGSKGSAESVRDPRGFSVKFYTDQGNYDLVMNDLPVFFIRDAIKFPDFIHSFKPSPINNKQDPNRQFDFLSKTPESTNMLTFLFSDLGTPANYRSVPGFGVHAFKWINAKGQTTYVKYTFTPHEGVKTLTREQAMQLAGENPEAYTIDLYDHIRAGEFPVWDVSIQTLKPSQLNNFEFNPLDDTKDWPAALIPKRKIGTMTLNKVPDNFFESTEESAFDPGIMVPGIEPSEDKMLQGRTYSYSDTQRYRLGVNYQSLPINQSHVPVSNNNQDGFMNSGHKTGDINYEPSTNPAPYAADPAYKYSHYPLSALVTQQKIDKPDDFKQAGETYRAFTAEEQDHLIHNLQADLGQVKNQEIQYTMASYFYKADTTYGTRLSQALNLDLGRVKQMASQLP